MPSLPITSFIERDLTNGEFRAALMNLTQLMTYQVRVVNNHFVAQTNQGLGPQPYSSTLASIIHEDEPSLFLVELRSMNINKVS